MQNGHKNKLSLKLFFKNIARGFQWLLPGLGFKRWLLLTVAGAMMIGLGLALVVLDIYRNAPETWWLPALSFLSLRFLARPIRFILFGGVGLILILVGIAGANRSLLRPFLPAGKPVLEALHKYRRKERGARIVVIGGGHGLASLLRGLKEFTHNITAIVTVADNGGSSGELRRNMGILPPGDIRNCLAALSSDEALLSQVFQYRFASGAGLEGHSLGNLFITALTEITGSFEEAVAESGRVLAIYGQVLPSTLSNVELMAEVLEPNSFQTIHVRGESEITDSQGKIQRVWLNPSNTPVFPPAVSAILAADLIILGPGSLYTSLLPNLLVRELSEAVQSSRALKFFVCNVATQRGETDGYSASDHVKMVEKHIGKNLFDLVICNRTFSGNLGTSVEWVKPDDALKENYRVYEADLVDEICPWRHDSKKLAKTVMNLFEERTGPLNDH
jgi:uncharacterized cofD-like protein